MFRIFSSGLQPYLWVSDLGDNHCMSAQVIFPSPRQTCLLSISYCSELWYILLRLWELSYFVYLHYLI